MTAGPLVATDLDQTLIYSRRAMMRWGGGDAVTAVEAIDGVDASFMAADAAATLAVLGTQVAVVPVTTRTPEQLARVRVPGASRWAVAANGGVLLVDGVADPDWAEAVAKSLAGGLDADTVHRHAVAACRPEWTKLVRIASGLFCYAVLDRDAMPADLVDGEAEWAARHGWRVSLQGRKLYWVPAALTKTAAVAEVRRRTGATTVLAAGDSLLDADLLEAADAGIAARHGELVAAGWSARHVSVTAHEGLRAGTEIVQWFAAEVARRG